MKIKKDMSMSTDKDNEEIIRQNLFQGIQKGQWIVFDMDKNYDMNLDDFFKPFSYFNKDSWYNFRTRNFCRNKASLRMKRIMIYLVMLRDINLTKISRFATFVCVNSSLLILLWKISIPQNSYFTSSAKLKFVLFYITKFN